jgi:hypothetical protein
MAMIIPAEAFDPMLSQLQQAEDLSPDSTPRISSNQSNEERWADMAFETPCKNNYELAVRDQQVLKKEEWSVQPYVDETEVSFSNMALTEDLDSVGSRLHDSGRCKPCAFFHTKGCNSGSGCLFCHRCPAHEKQRRKRLRRQLCHSLLNSFDGRGSRSQGDARLGHPMKANHARMVSTDTTSTCSGWASTVEGQLAHSRTTSTSSQAAASIYENGDVTNMGYAVQSPQAMYSNAAAQAQMHMSPQNNMQPVMSMMVAPPAQMVPMPHQCNESWNEARRNDAMDFEAQALSPAGSLDMDGHGCLNSMPPTPAGKLQLPGLRPQPAPLCLEPLPPPSGVQQGNGEQQPMQCPSVPVSPVGYMQCGQVQYALVPVPMQQYNDGPTYMGSPTYNMTQAKFPAMEQPQQQQQWGGPYEVPVNSVNYAPEQRWPAPYEVPMAAGGPMSPCGVATVGPNQWW